METGLNSVHRSIGYRIKNLSRSQFYHETLFQMTGVAAVFFSLHMLLFGLTLLEYHSPPLYRSHDDLLMCSLLRTRCAKFVSRRSDEPTRRRRLFVPVQSPNEAVCETCARKTLFDHDRYVNISVSDRSLRGSSPMPLEKSCRPSVCTNRTAFH